MGYRDTEKAVQADIKNALKRLGAFEWRDEFADLPLEDATVPVWIYDFSQPRAAMQTPGISDLLLIGFGLLTWVEVKHPKVKKKLRPSQAHFRDILPTGIGVRYEVWESSLEAMAWWERSKRDFRRCTGT
jgi:hypothetical protein